MKLRSNSSWNKRYTLGWERDYYFFFSACEAFFLMFSSITRAENTWSSNSKISQPIIALALYRRTTKWIHPREFNLLLLACPALNSNHSILSSECHWMYRNRDVIFSFSRNSTLNSRQVVLKKTRWNLSIGFVFPFQTSESDRFPSQFLRPSA